MPTIEVMTVSSSAPESVLDRLMTAAEESLHAEHARRIWVEPTAAGVTVMAEFSDEVGL